MIRVNRFTHSTDLTCEFTDQSRVTRQPIVVGQLPVLPPALIVTNEAAAAAMFSLGSNSGDWWNLILE